MTEAGPDGRLEMDVFAHCAGDAGMSGGLPPGTYQLELRASILGVLTPPPPIVATIELSCDEAARPDGGSDGAIADGGAPDAEGVADAGAKGGAGGGGGRSTGSGGTGGGGTGGGSAGAGGTPPTTPAAGDGCGCRLSGGAGTKAPLVGLALAAMLVRRRRRR
jgi:MYXO-CTERM domain-containing protein